MKTYIYVILLNPFNIYIYLVCVEELTLRLHGCRHLRHVALALPTALQCLELRLDSCERLQDVQELLRSFGAEPKRRKDMAWLN